MKGQPKVRCKIAAEFKISIGFLAAQSMMQMCSVQHQPQLPVSINKPT
jgi:hypothetical protein